MPLFHDAACPHLMPAAALCARRLARLPGLCIRHTRRREGRAGRAGLQQAAQCVWRRPAGRPAAGGRQWHGHRCEACCHRIEVRCSGQRGLRRHAQRRDLPHMPRSACGTACMSPDSASSRYALSAFVHAWYAQQRGIAAQPHRQLIRTWHTFSKESDALADGCPMQILERPLASADAACAPWHSAGHVCSFRVSSAEQGAAVRTRMLRACTCMDSMHTLGMQCLVLLLRACWVVIDCMCVPKVHLHASKATCMHCM